MLIKMHEINKKFNGFLRNYILYQIVITSKLIPVHFIVFHVH